MIGLIIFSIIVGLFLSSISGILGLVVGIVLFVCGLPFAIITGFIHGEIKYAQDRSDYREEMRQLAEFERDLDRDIARDMRRSERENRIIYHDNRQIHIHGDDSKY